MSLSSLPILDLSLADDPQHADDFRRQLRDVTHSVGFFYLTGHGIPASDFSELLDVAQRFFALPEQDKLSIENTNSPHFRGYTRVGGERTLGNVDWREQIDIGPHREPVAQPLHTYDRLTGPTFTRTPSQNSKPSPTRGTKNSQQSANGCCPNGL